MHPPLLRMDASRPLVGEREGRSKALGRALTQQRAYLLGERRPLADTRGSLAVVLAERHPLRVGEAAIDERHCVPGIAPAGLSWAGACSHPLAGSKSGAAPLRHRLTVTDQEVRSVFYGSCAINITSPAPVEDGEE